MAAIGESLEITLDQVQAIIDKHHPSKVTISSFRPVKVDSFSALTPIQTYAVDLSDDTSYLFKTSYPPLADLPTYTANTLETENALSQLLSKHDDIPQLKVYAFDTTLATLPYHYLLLSYPKGITLAQAKSSGKLTDRQLLLLDLRIGSHLQKIHSEIQNDWFGLPNQEKDELYSWQEAFTLLLEELLCEAQESGLGEDGEDNVPFEEIRKYLSRAIGFFLFDDCEVPSLISFLGSDESIIVDFDPEDGTPNDEIPITSLVSLSHALWGDPLLETLFLEPSKALLEGYGENLMVFARQKTKRTWYTLFLALVVIIQTRRDSVASEVELVDKMKWARETLRKCVKDLKDEPYY
ncbi:hypothetical protein ABKN59_009022 [Abortiporus biennis]